MPTPSNQPDPDPSQPRWLLVSDIDHTLTGDTPSLGRFITALSRSPQLALALNSSRPAHSVDQTLAQLFAPFQPLATITAMGTEIRLRGRTLSQWSRRFASWNRQPIDQLMAQLGHAPHPPEFQTPHKASFAVPIPDQPHAIRAIQSLGLPTRIITSGQSDFDVLPPSADKGAATLFLAQHLHIDHDRLIVAGDSANDLDMFRAAPHAIAVANARPELLHAVDPQRTFFATLPFAAGVLQGLAHFNALDPALDPSLTPPTLPAQHAPSQE